MRTVIIIPSRYESKRFPGKPLAKIEGTPMILRVIRQAKDEYELVKHLLYDLETYVATDDKRIYDVVTQYGYKAIMTGICDTGTDRVYEAAMQIEADIYINVQGDEPLIKPADIARVIQTKQKYMSYVIGSIAKIKPCDLNNNNVVKVIVDNKYNLIKMTRQPINTEYKQCGIYAYTLEELKQFTNNKHKQVEDIELTRMNKVKMVPVSSVPAVDVPDDIVKVEQFIKRYRSSRKKM
jgi:3-deoxy-manno-octulosonate cytidylyltransferase (CMP-KDO synthetase)